MPAGEKFVMPKWLLYSFASAVCFGVWGFVSKIAADGVPPMQNLILSAAGLVPPALLLLPSIQWRAERSVGRGMLFGFLTGIFGGLGNLSLYAALSGGGKAAVVFPLTAIYPLITVLIAWLLLREQLSRAQLGGIAAALASIIAFSAEAGSLKEPSSWLRQLSISPWIGFSFLTLFLWGFTGVMQRLSSNYVCAEISLLGFTTAFLTISMFLPFTQKLAWDFPARQWAYAIAGGALNSLGTLASFVAFRHGGKAAIVTPLVALYPMLTVLLAVAVLREKIGWREVIGIILALVAALALSREKKSCADDDRTPANAA
jgi:drug/metabolite transporter (DMT)-like permease